MLEYLAYALLGVVTIGCLLYVTMSPEAEDALARELRYFATRSNSLAKTSSTVARSLLPRHYTS
jgi:hypothetical protein